MTLASAIRHWDFRGIVVKQFWGLPYAMAALSTVARISDRTSLLAISVIASFAAVALAWHLWGGWIAGFFAILNLDWLQRSYLGGSEPLFAALLFASFLAVRKERWLIAALLASLATVVRPLGMFALIGIGVALFWRRSYRTLLLAILIGGVVGVLYTLPLAQHFGDPLATVNSYHSREWQGGWLFGFPFYAIIKGTLTEPAPLTNLVLSFGWIFLVLVAIVVMLRSVRFREYARNHVVETIFLIPYFGLSIPTTTRIGRAATSRALQFRLFLSSCLLSIAGSPRTSAFCGYWER
jgi:Gpi18-like mannosyltransferase